MIYCVYRLNKYQRKEGVMLGLASTKRIRKKVFYSLGLMVFLELFLGGVAIYNLALLSDSTKKLYNHPYTVISATKTIQSDIISIYRYMNDILLSTCDDDIQLALREIEIAEKSILKEFDVISNRFLGDKAKVKEFYTTYLASKPLRDKVLLLIKEQKHDQAVHLIKTEGSRHLEKLNEFALSLIVFAQNKADHYLEDSIETKYIALYTIVFIVTIILLILTIATGLLLKNIERIHSNQKRLQKTFIIQSRMAQMGELLSMIAHQWKQPLSAISAINTNRKVKLMTRDYDFSNKEEYEAFAKNIMKESDEIERYIHNMVVTLDDFRNFYRPNKKSSFIPINEPINKALEIIGPSLSSNNIEVKKETFIDLKINIYENELIQVILNVLKNAQDNFIEKNTVRPQITLTTNVDKNSLILEICDNGGGISNDILEKIFDAYFSTKDEKIGTGLGLYMSKTIIEQHHRGQMYAVARDNGACFVIELPLENTSS